MSAIKDEKSYFQGKINGLKEAKALLNSGNYDLSQTIQKQINECEEVLSMLNKNH